MSHFFLSYRRDDSAGFAGRLADGLEAAFGDGSVFRDVDDIRPGADFQATIHDQLQRVDAVLVMIGPRWLLARQRLEDPGDFVRLEIAAALASGKPVIPILVGGAIMPGEPDLPEALNALARRQAVSLSDDGWQGDLARLVTALKTLAPGLSQADARRRRTWMLGSMVGAGLGLALLLGVLALPQRSTQTAPAAPPALTLTDLTGRWTAEVKYDWGDQYQEVFEFKDLGGRLHGSASFLKGRLAIEQARLEGNWVYFITRSQEMLGSDQPWKEVTHRYTGQVTPEGIRFTLEKSGGYTLQPPIEFVARRAGTD